MSLAWSTMPPPSYTHILLSDTIPASIPYQLIQSPLCGAVLSYAFLDTAGFAAPSWIYDVPGSHIELNPTNLALATTYSFTLTASEATSGV